MTVAAVCMALVALWAWHAGASLLDDDRAPLAARLVGGFVLQIGGLVLLIAAVAVGVEATR